MQFRQGVGVRTSDGKAVGQLDRVVIDPRTKEINYIIVRKGVFFTTDRVVPLTLVAQADEGEIILRDDAGDLEQLPQFEERYYVPTDATTIAPADGNAAPTYYSYPPVGGGEVGGVAGMTFTSQMGTRPLPAQQPVVEQRERAIPEDNVAIRAGARVVAADGTDVGAVEQVLAGPHADQVSHFVISQGLLFKDRKLIPVNWVQDIGEEQVTLAVDAGFVSRLGSYSEGDAA